MTGELAVGDSHVQELDPMWQGTVEGAVALRDHSALVLDQGLLQRVSALGQVSAPLRAEVQGLQAATLISDGQLLVSADEQLLVGSDRLGEASLSALTRGPVRSITADGQTLWLQDDEGLLRWRDDLTQRPELEGLPLGAPSAAMTASGQAWLWATWEDLLLGLQRIDGDWLVQEQLDAGQVLGVAAHSGGVVSLVDDRVRARDADGALLEYTLSSPGVGVWSHALAPGAWVGTENGLLWVADGQVHPIDDSQELVPGGVDRAGRLLVQDGEQLSWLSVDRPVLLLGADDGDALEGPTRVDVVASQPGWVESMEVTLDGNPLDATEGVASLTLDPQDWVAGSAHELQVSVTYSDGQRSEALFTFLVDLPEVVGWSEHIEPLYQADCATCHAGSTETVLESPDDWSPRIERVLEMVESGDMPLGGDALTAAEIALIRAWRDGGYAP